MGRANESGAFFALIIGDEEVQAGTVAAKNLRTGEQLPISVDGLAEELKEVRLPVESLVRRGVPEKAIDLRGRSE
jgi:hypothetical protein